MAASTLTGISLSSIRSCLTNSTAFLSTSSSWKRSGLKQWSTQHDCQNTAEADGSTDQYDAQTCFTCFSSWLKNYSRCQWCPTRCVSDHYNMSVVVKRLKHWLTLTEWTTQQDCREESQWRVKAETALAWKQQTHAARVWIIHWGRGALHHAVHKGLEISFTGTQKKQKKTTEPPSCGGGHVAPSAENVTALAQVEFTCTWEQSG